MKKNKKLLAPLITAVFLNFSIQAEGHSSLSSGSFTLFPYVGVDVGVRYLDFQRWVGRGLFIKTVPQTNLYVGLRFHDNFGIEVGWEATPLKSKTMTFKRGDQNLGFEIPGLMDPEVHTFKWKLEGWHVNLIGYTPNFSDRYHFSFFGSIGLAHKKVIIQHLPISAAGIFLSDALLKKCRGTFAKYRSLFRTTVGLQYMLPHHFRIRAYFGWENTNQFGRLKTKERLSGVTTVGLDNSVSLNLGVLYQF